MSATNHASANVEIKSLPIDSIRTDGGTQSRVELNQEAIDFYRERWVAGLAFDPIDVFFDDTNYWPADGFHRIESAKAANLASILAQVRPGTRRDAILFAAGANDHHGVRLTRADKRKAIMTLLLDKEWGKNSSSWIAERCNVSPNTVEACRRELQSTSQLQGSSEPRLGKDGKCRRLPQRSERNLPAAKNTAPHAHEQPETNSKPTVKRKSSLLPFQNLDALIGKAIRATDDTYKVSSDANSRDEVLDQLGNACRAVNAWKSKEKRRINSPSKQGSIPDEQTTVNPEDIGKLSDWRERLAVLKEQIERATVAPEDEHLREAVLNDIDISSLDLARLLQQMRARFQSNE